MHMKEVMGIAGKWLVTAALGLAFVSPGALKAEDLNGVLRKLDAAAARFKSTTADFKFDTVQTDPIPDEDVQAGTVYYERTGNAFQMGVHIQTDNSRTAPKTMVFSHGVLKVYDKLQDQVVTVAKASSYEGYIALGFGASGKDLEQKWNIKYLGSDTVSGVKTEKLELVAKDPAVLKIFQKVTIWIDPDRGVSLKQVFDEGQGQTRTCTYSDIKLNQAVPGDAFTFKTDAKTTFINR